MIFSIQLLFNEHFNIDIEHLKTLKTNLKK